MGRKRLRNSRLANLKAVLLMEPRNTSLLRRLRVLLVSPGTESTPLLKKNTLLWWHVDYQKPQNQAQGLSESRNIATIDRFVKKFK
jgi:hypothetical protein